MMQEGEKNYDFIIIYSFILKRVSHQIKNVTFNQIKTDYRHENETCGLIRLDISCFPFTKQ